MNGMRPYIFHDVCRNLRSNMLLYQESMHRFAAFALKFVLSDERSRKETDIKGP
jgi:hypothetical protein